MLSLIESQERDANWKRAMLSLIESQERDAIKLSRVKETINDCLSLLLCCSALSQPFFLLPKLSSIHRPLLPNPL